MRIAALSFDLDGTLYDAAALRWRYAWANFRALRTVRVALRVREELRGHAFSDGAAYRDEEARRVAERLDLAPPEARMQIDRALGEYMVAALRRCGPRADARPALEAALARGLRIAVVSDYAVEDKLAALGLADLPWAACVAADALGALKPHPRAFESCAAALGVASSAIAHIGDRLDTDVAGARAAGMAAGLLGAPTPEVVASYRLEELVGRFAGAAD